MIKLTIPHELRIMHTSIAKWDGAALFTRLKQPNNSVTGTSIELLEMRKAAIHLPDVASWQSVRGDLMELFDDYSTKIETGEIPSDEKLSLRKQKLLIEEKCDDVLVGKCAQFGKWFKGLVSDMGLEMAHCQPVVILCDSQSAITIAESPVHVINKYSKHIERRVHWFREQIREGTLRVQHGPGTDNIADLFTKCLGVQVFQKYRDSLLRGDFRVLDNGGSYMCIVDDSTYPLKRTDASSKKSKRSTCLLS